jgi:hypothetical protein
MSEATSQAMTDLTNPGTLAPRVDHLSPSLRHPTNLADVSQKSLTISQVAPKHLGKNMSICHRLLLRRLRFRHSVPSSPNRLFPLQSPLLGKFLNQTRMCPHCDHPQIQRSSPKFLQLHPRLISSKLPADLKLIAYRTDLRLTSKI